MSELVREKEDIDLEELRKSKNAEEVMTFLNNAIDAHIKWETKTKAEVIKLAAEKYAEAGYPIKEIKELIIERSGGRLRPHYVGQCLDERFKKAVNVESGKKSAEQRAALKKAMANTGAGIASSSETVLIPPQIAHESDGGDADHEGYDPSLSKADREHLPDIEPQLESDAPDYITEITKQSKYSDEYVASLEEQIKALKGELPYKDCLATMRIVKVDKVTENRLLNASKAAKAHVYMVVDIRSNEIREIFTDTEYQKQLKQSEQKSKKGRA